MPFLPNGCPLTTFPRRVVQTRMGDFEHRKTFRYTFVDGDARVLTHFTSQSCTFHSIAHSRSLSLRNVRSIIQQTLPRRLRTFFLDSHLERLSDSEKKVSHWLASQDNAIEIFQPPAESELSRSQLWQAIRFLTRHDFDENSPIASRHASS